MDESIDLHEPHCELYREGARHRQLTAEENHGRLCHFLNQRNEAGYTMLLKRADVDVNFCMSLGSGRSGPVAFEAARLFSVNGMLAIARHPDFDPSVTLADDTPLLWYMLLQGWVWPRSPQRKDIFRQLLDHPRLNIWPVLKSAFRANYANPYVRSLLQVGGDRALLFVLAQPVHVRRLLLRPNRKNWLTKDLVRLVGSFLTYKKV